MTIKVKGLKAEVEDNDEITTAEFELEADKHLRGKAETKRARSEY